MKLKKHERHAAYIIMLAEAEEKLNKKDYKGGLCALSGVLDNEGDGVDKWIFIDLHLPELDILLSKANPNYYDGVYAFLCDKDGWQKRIELLKQCIEETYEW